MNLIVKLISLSLAAMLLTGCVDEYNDSPYAYYPKRHVVVTRTYHQPSRPVVVHHYYEPYQHRTPVPVRVVVHKPSAPHLSKKVIVTRKNKKRLDSSEARVVVSRSTQ